jgi:signal transduction histidine kinase
MLVEIREDLELREDEWSTCLLHSFVNIVGVVQVRLALLGRQLPDSGEVEEIRAELSEFRDALLGPGPVTRFEAGVPVRRHILQFVEERLRDGPEDARSTAAILEEVCHVWAERESELRQGSLTSWRVIPQDEVRTAVHRMFDAIAAVSGGRYGVVYRADVRGPRDYWLDLALEGGQPEGLLLPPLLLDTLRDLLANARKYSEPGTRIIGALRDDAREVVLRVEDRGRGIPSEDLPRVVRLGERGSNVGQGETHGFGAGLTKAFATTRLLGGRMWIDSEVGLGTTVLLRVPKPS